MFFLRRYTKFIVFHNKNPYPLAKQNNPHYIITPHLIYHYDKYINRLSVGYTHRLTRYFLIIKHKTLTYFVSYTTKSETEPIYLIAPDSIQFIEMEIYNRYARKLICIIRESMQWHHMAINNIITKKIVYNPQKCLCGRHDKNAKCIIMRNKKI